MAWVRAKETVYLPAHEGGYRQKGEEFEHNGEPNENLEEVDKRPYYSFSTGELKAEIAKRGIVLPPPTFGTADHKTLNDLLIADDNTRKAVIEAQPVKPAKGGKGSKGKNTVVVDEPDAEPELPEVDSYSDDQDSAADFADDVK